MPARRSGATGTTLLLVCTKLKLPLLLPCPPSLACCAPARRRAGVPSPLSTPPLPSSRASGVMPEPEPRLPGPPPPADAGRGANTDPDPASPAAVPAASGSGPSSAAAPLATFGGAAADDECAPGCRDAEPELPTPASDGCGAEGGRGGSAARTCGKDAGCGGTPPPPWLPDGIAPSPGPPLADDTPWSGATSRRSDAGCASRGLRGGGGNLPGLQRRNGNTHSVEMSTWCSISCPRAHAASPPSRLVRAHC